MKYLESMKQLRSLQHRLTQGHSAIRGGISKGQQGNLLSSLRVHVHRYSCKQTMESIAADPAMEILSLQPECIR